MTREITHMKAFTAALESMGKPRFQIGQIPPTPGLVDQFFNDSTGAGEDGEVDARGPWNRRRATGSGRGARVPGTGPGFGEPAGAQVDDADDEYRPTTPRSCRNSSSISFAILLEPKGSWSRRFPR